MATYSFSQVDVFGSGRLTGNPVAVVHDASNLREEQLAAFARWTNLSETTFLLPARDPAADYRLRIFTPLQELPFAGHPTLGSAQAWLRAGGVPREEGRLVQECELGLVPLQVSADEAAFQAPALLRSGPVDEVTLGRVLRALGADPTIVVGASWVDNGPGWIGVELATADDVLALRPDFAAMRGLELGVIGRHDPDVGVRIGADFEVRAFCPEYAVPEDPVTGSLNAGLAQWLTAAGRAPGDYVVRQGTVIGRDGRVRVTTDPEGEVWVRGACRTVLRGTVTL